MMTADRRRVPPGAGQPGRQRLGRVLLVEDEQDVAELIRYNLTKEGYDVILSGNGNEALRLAREHDLEIDRHRFEVRMKGRPVELTPKEFELLATWPAPPGGCSDGRSCSTSCGAATDSSNLAPWTSMWRDCAESSRSRGSRSPESRPSGASGTASETNRNTFVTRPLCGRNTSARSWPGKRPKEND